MRKYISDIKSFNWTKENFIILKSLIKQIFASLYFAFQKYGFIHSDVHFMNYLIKKIDIIETELKYDNISIKLYGYKLVIIDFENSLFESTKQNYDFLYNDFTTIINNISYELKINITNIITIISYIEKNKNEKLLLDINKLLSLVDDLEMKDKIDISNIKLIYNPDL
jgi:predicted unusual protein kinase regulating ubiquinone biosynthesis (AarF/ABC1/UbiB family)